MVGGVIWDRWGKFRQFGYQIGGNLGQARKLIRSFKPFGPIFLYDNFSIGPLLDKKKVKKLGGVIWDSGSRDIDDDPIFTRLHDCHGPCQKILNLRGNVHKPMGKTVPNLPTPIFRWGKVGQSYFVKYLLNKSSKTRLSQYLVKYSSEIPFS